MITPIPNETVKSGLMAMSAVELAQAIREQKVTSEEAVRAVFEKIDERECIVKAYLDFYREESIEKARAADELVRKTADPSALPPLLGVPVAIKDNLSLCGKKMTCASKMLQDYTPPYTATCVEKLEKSGAIVIGKTNMDEFGMGASTEHSCFSTTTHPLDKTRVPGGSSGGSAAAVACGEAFAALGTDTGGSVRQPAAFCGLVGLRPTYGSVSRHGLTAFSSSMDTVGPITRSSIDAAVFFNTVKGADPKDQTSIFSPDVDISAMENYSVRGKRIGIPKPLLGEGESSETVRKAKVLFEEYGAKVDEIDMPVLDYAVAIYYILSSAEASANLARYDGIRYGYRASDVSDLSDLYRKTRTEGFGKEVKRRILLGNYVLSSEHFDDCYRQAERARNMLKKAFSEAFTKYDLLLSPSAPGVAPHLGEIDKDPLSAYIADLCTVPASLAGIPAVSVPFGTYGEPGSDAIALPVGIQLMGPRFGEQEILGAARFFEKTGPSGKGGGA